MFLETLTDLEHMNNSPVYLQKFFSINLRRKTSLLHNLLFCVYSH
jgi:hypothetical protein